jgi:sigma-E factor negative regulatory protein RseA
MTEDSLKEKLCLLLDGELGQDESLALLSRIETDPALQAQWRRYRLIGEAMRSKDALLPDSRFVDRIGTALADEPTVLVPMPAKRRYREKAVTAALAASLATVAVLAGKSLSDYSPMRGPELLAKADLGGSNGQSSIDPEFRDYLVTHYETAYLSGTQGMLPSVRLVSSGSTR